MYNGWYAIKHNQTKQNFLVLGSNTSNNLIVNIFNDTEVIC